MNNVPKVQNSPPYITLESMVHLDYTYTYVFYVSKTCPASARQSSSLVKALEDSTVDGHDSSMGFSELV